MGKPRKVVVKFITEVSRIPSSLRPALTKYLRKSKAYWIAFVRDLQRDLGKSEEKPINAVQLTLLLFHAGRYPVMSWNVSDWRKGKCVPWRAAQNKMIRLRKCLNALGDMVVREDRWRFFNEPHPLLEKKSPAQFLDNTPGMKRVLALLDSLESGAYA